MQNDYEPKLRHNHDAKSPYNLIDRKKNIENSKTQQQRKSRSRMMGGFEPVTSVKSTIAGS